MELQGELVINDPALIKNPAEVPSLTLLLILTSDLHGKGKQKMQISTSMKMDQTVFILPLQIFILTKTPFALIRDRLLSKRSSMWDSLV